MVDRVPQTGFVALAGKCEAAESGDFYENYLGPMESRMMRTIWRIVRERELARDTLQEALTVLWRRREVIRSHPNREALILRVCINAACDSLRRRQRRMRFETEESGVLSDKADPRWKDPSEEGIPNEEVRRALSRLAPNQAAALLLRVIEDQSYPTIAAALGCSVPTARIHVMRARFRLRHWLAHLAPAQRRQGGEA